MKVKFMPSGEEHEIEFNETILHLAQRVGLHIQSVCKGIPSCAECRIQIMDGEHHVLPPNKKEIDLIGTAHYVDLSRLACQLRCFGDVTVDLAEQIEKEKRVSEKPRDRMARSDGQESKAVLGGILDNVVAADVELDEEGREVEKVEVEAVTKAPKLDKKNAFYGDFYTGKKKKKTSQSRGQNTGGKGRNKKQNKRQAQGSDQTEGSDKPKRKRNRRHRKPGNKGGGESQTPKGNA